VLAMVLVALLAALLLLAGVVLLWMLLELEWLFLVFLPAMAMAAAIFRLGGRDRGAN
jgi:hypothetical protein